MKVIHRGHKISVERQRCLGGWTMLFWSVFREADGYECASGFSDSSDTVREMVTTLRERVDAELAEDDPWMERAESGECNEPDPDADASWEVGFETPDRENP